MSTPTDFLHRVLDEADDSVSGYVKSRAQNPEIARKTAVLRKLEDLRVKGEELSIKAQIQQQENQRMVSMRMKADTLAEGGTGKTLMGPPNPDPVSAAEEEAGIQTGTVDPSQIGGDPEDQGFTSSIAKAAEERAKMGRTDKILRRETQRVQMQAQQSPVTAHEAQLWNDELKLNVQVGEVFTKDQRDSIQQMMNRKALGKGLGSPTDRYGAAIRYARDGSVVGLDRVTGKRLFADPQTFGSAPQVSDATESALSGTKESLDQLAEMRLTLSEASSAMGPIKGRLTRFSSENLGSFGLKPETIENIVSMRRGTMLEAFTNGGKQLTATEKVEFFALMPQPQDSIPAAAIKLDKAEAYLRRKMRNRVLATSPKERAGISRSLGGDAPDPADAAADSGELTPEEIAIRKKYGLPEK